MASATILFDGVCTLCNRSVLFVLRRDPTGYFQFAPLQSDAARQILQQRGRSSTGLESICVLTDNGLLQRSDAVLEILRRLQHPWPLLWSLRYIPHAIRDGLYNFVARRRYRWFGRSDTCALPQPGWEQRFLA